MHDGRLDRSPAEAAIERTGRHQEIIPMIIALPREVVRVGRIAGQALFIPRGAAHQFVNRHPGTVRFPATVTPGVLRPDFFREVGALVNAGGPPGPQAIGAIMARHGLQPV
jgi:hypothetical protein